MDLNRGKVGRISLATITNLKIKNYTIHHLGTLAKVCLLSL